MRVRAIDTQGDWTFGKSQNDYKKDKAALSQNLKTRINSFLGDCFFDQGAGIDWFNLLGAKDQTALNLAISNVIFNTQGVTGIAFVDITLNAVTRHAVVRYNVTTNLGILTGSVDQAGPTI